MEFQNPPEVDVASRYMKRALTRAVAAATAPVVVLEGAPGTGKTTLVRNEDAFKGFHYVSLADEDEFAQALAQPEEWLAHLPRPAIIDDAHRVEGLLAAAQQVASAENVPSLTFLLLSSDPLGTSENGETAETAEQAEQAESCTQHFMLYPLTQAEIHGRTNCIIDDLFDGDVMHRFCSFHTRSDLRTMMRIGGFPARVTHPVHALSRRAGESPLWVPDLRTISCDPDAADTGIDQLIGKAILDKILTNPGISLGVDGVASACSVDAATLTAYLEMLRGKGLIHKLTMLDKKKPQQVSFGKTRIYPVDTVFAVDALCQDGHDITVEPPIFAKALRTLCLDQLIPAVQWAKEPTEYYHWKKFDHRMREVDLVLKRGQKLVGITIRNSLAARHDTVGALRLLAEDERFVRGFILYMGMSPRRLTEKIWALPISALWEPEAFLPGLSSFQD